VKLIEHVVRFQDIVIEVWQKIHLVTVLQADRYFKSREEGSNEYIPVWLLPQPVVRFLP
jgi:hypothetical protein